MPPVADRPHVFESGQSIYLVAPISPFTPGSEDIETFAFAENLKAQAPNEHLLWLKGNYVEADNANANGHQWTAEELAIKSITPMYCPVTVMHDPRSAVGLIADTRLLTPEKDGVKRARIETVLAIWAHRFPDIAAEVMHNYEAGELMQSMECMAPYYSCADCGKTYHKLPDGAEEAQWCAHLAESPNAGRILGGVTFTGTGLIFGSRGARGAYSEANLETAVQKEIVAAHSELHTGTKKPTSRSERKNVMDIDQAKYDELIARPTQEVHASVVDERDKLRDEKAQAVKDAEAAEIAQKAAEKKADDLETEKTAAEEKVRQGELASDRLSKLGADFKAALGDTTTKRVEEQAKDLKDEDWEARLVELEDLTKVKRDAGGASTTAAADAGSTLTPEETASARLGGGGGGGGGAAPSEAGRSAVIGGLARRHLAPAGKKS